MMATEGITLVGVHELYDLKLMKTDIYRNALYQ